MFVDRRARTERQKREVLEAVLKKWIGNSDLRLGQFLINITEGQDLYFIEDYDLLDLVNI